MSIDVGQLVNYIIKPALKQINLYSDAAEQLVLGTCAQESGLGTYLHQVGGGPALGIFQMEPATYNNIWSQFLASKESLGKSILANCSYVGVPHEDVMIGDLKYAAMMCRIRYLWVSHPLPNFNDIQAQGAYWGKYYNGNPVNGRAENYVNSYKKYIGSFYG